MVDIHGYTRQANDGRVDTSASGGIGANIIGSPKTVIERIRRYQSLGVDLFMLQFYPMRQGLDVFAEQIMPEIKVVRGDPSGGWQVRTGLKP